MEGGRGNCYWLMTHVIGYKFANQLPITSEDSIDSFLPSPNFIIVRPRNEKVCRLIAFLMQRYMYPVRDLLKKMDTQINCCICIAMHVYLWWGDAE